MAANGKIQHRRPPSRNPKLASQHNLEMEHTSHLLALPTELLEHIFQFTKPGDTKHLRLICSKLAGAALHRFSTRYLTKLNCSIIDQQRLSNVNRLLSRPYLARRIKEFHFSLSSQKKLPQRAATLDQRMARGAGSPRQQDGYVDARALGFALDNINTRMLIKDIMRWLRLLPCRVGFNFVQKGDFTLMSSPYMREGVEKLLLIAHEAHCAIDALQLTDRFILYDGPCRQVEQLPALVRNLKRFSYILCPESSFDSSDDNPSVVSHFTIIRSALTSITKLEAFSLRTMSTPHLFCSWDNEQVHSLIHSADFTSLKSLDLRCIQISVPDIMHILSQCRETLRSITLHEVCLPPWPPWWGILQELEELPMLEAVDFSHLQEMHPDDGVPLTMHHLLPGDVRYENGIGAGRWRVRCKGLGREGTRQWMKDLGGGMTWHVRPRGA